MGPEKRWFYPKPCGSHLFRAAFGGNFLETPTPLHVAIEGRRPGPERA
jgi:hypothetical protein